MQLPQLRKALADLAPGLADGMHLTYSDPEFSDADMATRREISAACLSTAACAGGAPDDCQKRLIEAGAHTGEATAALAGMMVMWMHLHLPAAPEQPEATR